MAADARLSWVTTLWLRVQELEGIPMLSCPACGRGAVTVLTPPSVSGMSHYRAHYRVSLCWTLPFTQEVPGPDHATGRDKSKIPSLQLSLSHQPPLACVLAPLRGIPTMNPSGTWCIFPEHSSLPSGCGQFSQIQV